jgi:hypothetical protein
MESLIDPHWRPDSRALGYPPSLGKQAREHRGNGKQTRESGSTAATETGEQNAGEREHSGNGNR